jgi:L-fuconolactonase
MSGIESAPRRRVDSHVHLWDPGRFAYPWLVGHPTLFRPYVLDDYAAATAHVPVESLVFMQCEAANEHAETEVAWIASLAEREPRIRGIVAWAPLHEGARARAHLDRLLQQPLVKGVRQIIQNQQDPAFCLTPGFQDGVALLGECGLCFDICVDHRQMGQVVEFARRHPGVRMVLDHIGKPDIRGGRLQPWAWHLRELASLPNVHCKISGVATEADHLTWTPDDLARYVEVAIDAFGFDRIMYGSDWPVATDAITYAGWVALLEKLMSGVAEADLDKFWRRNAEAFYRLGDRRARM